MERERAAEQVVLAVGGHPDDIEFMMAGTLLLLKEAGAPIHMWSMTDGSLGSISTDRVRTAAMRLDEACASARIAGAAFHGPIARDMELVCSVELVSRAAAVIRRASPRILLLPAPEDYHPDHRNASSVALSAVLAARLPAYQSRPPVPPLEAGVAIYHALPFGLRDPMGKVVEAGQYVDVTGELDHKTRMLDAHESQRDWLLASQGVDCLGVMEEMCRELGRASGAFEYAEGWRRRLYVGFSAEEGDPLSELLGPLCLTAPMADT